MSIKVQVKNNIDRSFYTENKGFGRNGYGRNGKSQVGFETRTGVTPTANWCAENSVWSGCEATIDQLATTNFTQVDAIDPVLAKSIAQLNAIDPIFVNKLTVIAGSCPWTTQKFVNVAMQDITLAKALLIVAQRNLHLAGQWAAQAFVNPVMIRQQLQMMGLPIFNVAAINTLFANLRTLNTGNQTFPVFANNAWPALQSGNFVPSITGLIDRQIDGRGINFGAMPSTNGSDVAPMKVDIFDDGAAYIVEAEVPGAVSEDVDVTIQDETLIIEAVCSRSTLGVGNKRSLLREKAGNKVWRREFNVGQDIDVRDISASMTGGLLKLVLPKMTVAETLTACQAA